MIRLFAYRIGTNFKFRFEYGQEENLLKSGQESWNPDSGPPTLFFTLIHAVQQRCAIVLYTPDGPEWKARCSGIICAYFLYCVTRDPRHGNLVSSYPVRTDRRTGSL
jgi:hypothetical protein